MIWWSWMILGAVLLGAELFAVDAQFYLVFLGVSAGLVGLTALLGIVMPDWAQWVAFAVLSLVFMFTFRRSLYMKFRGNVPGFQENMSGDFVTVSSDLAPGKDARVKHRGSEWTVMNVGDSAIVGGTKARIVRVEGLTLHISAE